MIKHDDEVENGYDNSDDKNDNQNVWKGVRGNVLVTQQALFHKPYSSPMAVLVLKIITMMIIPMKRRKWTENELDILKYLTDDDDDDERRKRKGIVYV